MKKRKIRIEGDLAFIPLTQGLEAIIDAADAPVMQARNWYAIRCKYTFYAGSGVVYGGGHQTMILLHRHILQAPKGVLVDHRDGNGLNCRRSNLRLASIDQNARNARLRKDNKVGLKGAHFCSRTQRWVSQISVGRQGKHLGYFDTAEQAHAAYCQAAAELHGEFARFL